MWEGKQMTKPTNQAEFFQAHAVDGTVPPELIGQMMNLPEGDTVFTTESGTPDPAATPAPAPAPADPPAPSPAPAPAETPAPAPADDPKPVILAKDGVHTIGYEKLEEARDGEKAAKAEAARLAAENEALRKAQSAAPSPAPAPTGAPAPAPAGEVDFGDYSDAALDKGIRQLVDMRAKELVDDIVAKKLGPIEEQRQKDAVTDHFTKILSAHPNMDSILQSAEFADWQKAQPSFTQAAIADVLTKGTAPQVIEVFDSYKKATEKAPPPAPAPSSAPASADAAAAAAKAAEAVAKAKNDPPSSLSEIPGGAGAVDEATAMLEMSPTALLARFNGKSPEEIHRALSKVI